MSSTKGFVREQQDQILLDSIRHQRPIVLTHSTAKGWRILKANFLCGSPESTELTVRVPKEGNEANPTPPPAGARLGGTFRLGHKKCMFACQVKIAHGHNECDDLVLNWPEQMQQLQRRAYERATPPQGSVVAVRFWHEGGDSGKEPRVVRHGQLEDVSCGGLRIKVPDPTEVLLGCTYKCVFTPKPGKPAIVVDTILRHRESVEHGRASLGFQFVGLETSPERLRTLDRLARMVRHFQRAKAKPAQALEESRAD